MIPWFCLTLACGVGVALGPVVWFACVAIWAAVYGPYLLHDYRQWKWRRKHPLDEFYAETVRALEEAYMAEGESPE